MIDSIIKPKRPTAPGPKRTPLIDRVLRLVKKTEAGCWEWQGKTNNNGYGQIGAGGKYGADLLVHRVTYEHFVGPIAPGLDIDHKCRNRLCCNPSTDHLEAVTRLVNLLRGEHPNMVTKRTGVCKNGHVIEGHNAMVGQDARVRCRTCYNDRMRKFRASKKHAANDEPAIVEDKGDYVLRGVTP